MWDIVAVEIWEPYVEQFFLNDIYNDVLVRDVRDVEATPRLAQYFDLIIFGDILEHMTKEEAVKVWQWARSIARHGLISGPIVSWPQDAVGGNPYEAHVQDDLNLWEYRHRFGPFDEEWVYPQTATFAVRFADSGPQTSQG
jgi:hypothetical protein